LTVLHLQVTIRFPADRYHGSDWPPSPARLFQALVAGGRTGAASRDWNVTHQRALEFLESLSPPDILARPARDGQRYTLFVPNNSLKDERSTKTSKPVRPKILSNHTPGQADIVYRWAVSDVEQARSHLPALDELASRLRTLGWGVDFAAAIAALEEAPPAPGDLELFTADGRVGVSLRVPKPGLLAHLGASHRAFTSRISKEGVNPYSRPTDFGQTRYRSAGSWQPRRWIALELMTPDGEAFAARWDQTQTIAAWLRHAVATALTEEEFDEAWVNCFALGHTEGADPGHRLSYVPLPSVGHPHSDGGIRRVLIVCPPSPTREESEALDLLSAKLSGWTLFGQDGGAPRAMLAPLTDARKVVPFYTEPARVWRTVTPVVLHGHNAARGRISLLKTDRLLRQAFEGSGMPEALICKIAFQTAPYWPGSEASGVIRVPRHLAQWPRAHVQVEFREAIQGPLLAGIGRHYGIGVFAARPGA
jgi:CRISPR-associated protein Csb2